MVSRSRPFWNRVPSVLALLAIFCTASAVVPARAQNLTPGDFESGLPAVNPWAGVDESGFLRVTQGKQLATDDSGRIRFDFFSPSVAVGDLNGDGLPDLVVADPNGFFWFFPNSGKPGAPAFTHGEIMPIWLGIDEIRRSTVPRIQLVDYDGDGKLDIVAGNFLGELYFIHNQGSTTMPDFRMPDDVSTIIVPTHTSGLLWCNFLAPFLYDWSKSGRLDLVIGEGTYSANSYYLFINQGSNSQPLFDEHHRLKLASGYGREHLTPQVVDWNEDGRPDIISGERAGFIDLYLNQTPDPNGLPVFNYDTQNPPQELSFGGTQQVGAFSTVCVTHLDNDKLFDIITSNTDGRILYSLNTGTPGHPVFGAFKPFTGVNPFPKIIAPTTWQITPYRPYGAPYELLQVTNAQVETGFSPPPDFKGQGALKFSVFQPHNVYFQRNYYPPESVPNHIHAANSNKRSIEYSVNTIPCQAGESYKVKLWVRTDGDVTEFQAHLQGLMGNATPSTYSANLDASSTWSQTTGTIRIDSTDRVSRTGRISRPKAGADLDAGSGNLFFRLDWKGDGTVYLDDIELSRE